MKPSRIGHSPSAREDSLSPRTAQANAVSRSAGSPPPLSPRAGRFCPESLQAGTSLVPRRLVLPDTPEPATAAPQDPAPALRQLVLVMRTLLDAPLISAAEGDPAGRREQLTRIIDTGVRIAELRACLPRRQAIRAISDTEFADRLEDVLDHGSQRAQLTLAPVDMEALKTKVNVDTQDYVKLLQGGQNGLPLARRIAQHHQVLLEQAATAVEYNQLGVLVREHALTLPLMRPPDERRTIEYQWLKFKAILPGHAYQQALSTLLVARWSASQEFPELFEGIDLAFEEVSLRHLAGGAIQSYEAEQPATGTMDPDVREVMTGIMTAASDHAACMEELAAQVAARMEPRHGPPQAHPAIRQLSDAASASWELARAALRLANASTPQPEPSGQTATAARPAGPGPRSGRKSKSKARPQSRRGAPAAAGEQSAAGPSEPARRTRVVCDGFGAKVLAAQEPQARPAPGPAPLATPAPPSDEAAGAQARLKRLAAQLDKDPRPRDRQQIRELQHKGTPEQAVQAMDDRAGIWLATARKMRATLAELDQPSRLHCLAPGDLARATELKQQARDRIDQLTTEARMMQASLARTKLDLMKLYRLPREAHWMQLFEQDEVRPVPAPRVLPSDRPNTLFEVQLPARPLSGGTRLPPPVWLHLHTHAPVTEAELRNLPFEAFAAAHLKSDLERRRGPQWQLEQAAQGKSKDEVMIHRGGVGRAFIAKVLGRAGASLADNPRP